MTQVQAPKILQLVATGSDDDESAVPKLTMTVLMVPGNGDVDDGINRQAHVYAQIIRRRR